jgi:hypothetical protein
MKVKKARQNLKNDSYTKYYYTIEHVRLNNIGTTPYPQLLEDIRSWEVPSKYDNQEVANVSYDTYRGALVIEISRV